MLFEGIFDSCSREFDFNIFMFTAYFQDTDSRVEGDTRRVCRVRWPSASLPAK